MYVLEQNTKQQQKAPLYTSHDTNDDSQPSQARMVRIFARLKELQRIVDITHEQNTAPPSSSRLTREQLARYIEHKLILIRTIIYDEVFTFRGAGCYDDFWQRWCVTCDRQLRQSMRSQLCDAFTDTISGFIGIASVIMGK